MGARLPKSLNRLLSLKTIGIVVVAADSSGSVVMLSVVISQSSQMAWLRCG